VASANAETNLGLRTLSMIPYRYVRPILHLLDAELAHRIVLAALRAGLAGGQRAPCDPILRSRVWGLEFPNPLGLAAGFDKDAEVTDAVLALGFGFVEAGTVTPRPQPGNPRPRLFRLVEDRAVINRFGFNSRGLSAYVAALARRRKALGIVGANVGKNKETVDAAADYEQGIEAVCAHADYLVCNVSSPNTPGLRGLQARAEIERLLQRVIEARSRSMRDGPRPPLLAKVGPDLTEEQVHDIAQVALTSGIDGLIVGNTTVARPSDLRSRYKGETGGLSGRPLLTPANACLAAMYRYTQGRVPLIGCGGVSTGADAYAKIRAGASLVQLYTALVYGGWELVSAILAELAQLLRADGFASVAEAVGVDQGRVLP
jgi:dihydroorotate dehydrogenase